MHKYHITSAEARIHASYWEVTTSFWKNLSVLNLILLGDDFSPAIEMGHKYFILSFCKDIGIVRHCFLLTEYWKMSYPQKTTTTIIARNRANDDTKTISVLHLIEVKTTPFLEEVVILLLNESTKLRLLGKNNLTSYSYILFFLYV